MSNLVDHARRELAIIGEDADTTEGLVRVVEAFAAMGHSGSSAFYCAGALDRLLRYQPLSALTNDPEEWTHIADDVAGQPDLWQSTRNPEAFSNDAGATYTLITEREASGSREVTPLHTSITNEATS